MRFSLLILVYLLISFSCRRIAEYEDKYESGQMEALAAGSNALTHFPVSNHLLNYSITGNVSNSSGRTYCALIDFSDSTHWLAGSSDGGVWTSNDNGDNWQALNDHMITTDVYRLAQSYFNHNVFYYCSSARLSDSTGLPIPDILRSTDGGITFHTLANGNFNPSGTKKIICSQSDSNTIYGYSREQAASGIPWYREQVFRSIDGGNTFEPLFIFNSPFTVKELIVFPNGAVLFSSLNDLYYSSSGDSGTYMLISNPFNLPAGRNISRIFMGSCRDFPDVVYAYLVAGSDKSIYKSIDGGMTWNKTFDLSTLSTGWSVLFGAIGVKPDNPDYIVVGDVSLAFSDDGGNSFQKFTGISGPDYHQIFFSPFDSNKLIVTNDHDVSFLDVRQPPQTTFTAKRNNMYTSLNHAGDYYYSGNGIITGRNDYGVQRNVGLSTFSVSGGDGTYCFIHKQDTQVAYITNQNARLTRYDDIYNLSGANSILNQLDTNHDFEADDGVMFIHPFEMNQTDGDQLYFPTHKWLWRSLDRGDNWEKSTNQLGFSSDPTVSLAIGSSSDPVACLVLDDTIWIKPNAASTPPGNEFPLAMTDSIRNVFILPGNDSIMYATFQTASRKIVRCTNVFDPNPIWSDISGNLPAFVRPTCIQVHPDDPDFIMAGSDHGLFVSTDGGVNWTLEENFPYVLISQLRLRQRDKKLFIFSWGRGVWTADLPVLSTHLPERTIEESVLFPNPFTDLLFIRTENQNWNLNTNITFYNTEGKFIYKTGISSTPLFTFDTHNWKAGMYFYKVESEGKNLSSGRVLKKNKLLDNHPVDAKIIISEKLIIT